MYKKKKKKKLPVLLYAINMVSVHMQLLSVGGFAESLQQAINNF